MSKDQPISKRDALQRMRDLSSKNIPFSFGYVSCNTTNQTSKGYRVIHKALLRPGMSHNQSDYSNILIGYIDYDNQDDTNRWFHYPLLIMFNGQIVKP
ncbi:MAG: hypothetical protein GW823_06430 [Bacteroidetes bacterium]|nr:hypothetical protein [Bacteroidota bacterium]